MRLIDADALRENLTKNIGLTNAIDVSFRETPTVDAVPVIMCKDCKSFGHYSDGSPCCDHLYGLGDIAPDDFCSRAERKEE